MKQISTFLNKSTENIILAAIIIAIVFGVVKCSFDSLKLSDNAKEAIVEINKKTQEKIDNNVIEINRLKENSKHIIDSIQSVEPIIKKIYIKTQNEILFSNRAIDSDFYRKFSARIEREKQNEDSAKFEREIERNNNVLKSLGNSR